MTHFINLVGNVGTPLQTLIAGIALFIRSLVRKDHKLDQLGLDMLNLKNEITLVRKEFKPNSGATLKDDMNLLKGDLRDVITKFDAHLNQHAGVWR